MAIRQLSQEEGIAEATLHKWRSDARGKGQLLPDAAAGSEGWTSRDRFAAVPETAAMNEVDLAEYCGRREVCLAQIKALRMARYTPINAPWSDGQSRLTSLARMNAPPFQVCLGPRHQRRYQRPFCARHIACVFIAVFDRVGDGWVRPRPSGSSFSLTTEQKHNLLKSNNRF